MLLSHNTHSATLLGSPSQLDGGKNVHARTSVDIEVRRLRLESAGTMMTDNDGRWGVKRQANQHPHTQRSASGKRGTKELEGLLLLLLLSCSSCVLLLAYTLSPPPPSSPPLSARPRAHDTNQINPSTRLLKLQEHLLESCRKTSTSPVRTPPINARVAALTRGAVRCRITPRCPL